MSEIWRDIKGFEGLYMASNLGRIKSMSRFVSNHHGDYYIKERIRKTSISGAGYERVVLSKDGVLTTFSVHRLVAFAFPDICGEYFEGAVVNHKNENKTDNRAENLEFVKQQDNVNYGTGLERLAKYFSKPIHQYDLNGELINKWKSSMEIERSLGYGHGYIDGCCNGKYKTAYGYVWKWNKKSLKEKSSRTDTNIDELK